jgi:hypothetical protein
MGDQTRFWTKWRTRFRWCRICVWLVILTLAGAVLWLDQIGVPDFVKRPFVDALRQHGIALQFVRLRLKIYRGLVADNVRLGGETPDSPSLTLQEVQLQINYHALLRRKLQLDGVFLRHGKFELPISTSNEPPCTLVVDQIQTELHFGTNDVWSLDNFQANFAGAKFVLSGQVSDASAMANWGMFHGKRGLRGASQSQLKKIGIALSQIHFNKTSQLSLNVQGDASNINSFFVFLGVNAPGVDTPWGSMHSLALVARSAGSLTPAQKTGSAAAPPLEIGWKAQLAGLKTDMMDIDYAYCTGSWHATGKIDGQVRLARMKSEKLNADFISCGGFWQAPEIELTNLYARLGGGQLQAAARLNLDTREFSFTNSSCFDPQAVATLLTEKVRERLDQFTLPQPPALAASGSLILAAWTNRSPDRWRVDVQPTVRLQGELAVTNAVFNGLSLSEVRAPFCYSNEIWTLSDAVITQPEGPLHISGAENDATKDYQWRLQGALSPDVIQPFLTPKAARGFNFFSFSQPVFLDTQIRGRLYDYDSITAAGHAALTNFSLRGESIDNVDTDFRYADRVAEFLHPHLQAGTQTMKADGVRLDWPGDRIYFTNGLGTADPLEVATAIGPVPEQVMKPYHFPQPPTASVTGYAPLRDATNADLDFKIIGTAQLECLRVRTPAISGEIHWFGQALILTNLSASLYGGRGHGNIAFDFRPHKGANFSFAASVQNVNLHSLAQDLDSPSNHLKHLDGRINGRFTLTSGNSENWRSCNGYGDIDLRNGLLWDVPVFGGVSPFLNSISPGLGNSQATDATAQFLMTNGVISTGNLKIDTRMMVLYANGTVNLRGDMNAHFTADLLRKVPVIGPFLGVVTWPVGKVFECKATGTWQNPKIRPTFFPTKFLFYMFHPLHSLEDMFPTNKPTDTPKP